MNYISLGQSTRLTTKLANAPKINLAPALMTEISDYLLGKVGFPANTFIIVSVASEAQPIRMLLTPWKAIENPFMKFEAHIPGLMFEWFIDAPPDGDKWSLNNPPSCIVLTDRVKQRISQIAVKNILESEPKGSLKKHSS